MAKWREPPGLSGEAKIPPLKTDTTSPEPHCHAGFPNHDRATTLQSLPWAEIRPTLEK